MIATRSTRSSAVRPVKYVRFVTSRLVPSKVADDGESNGTASVADARKTTTSDEADRRWFEFWKRK